MRENISFSKSIKSILIIIVLFSVSIQPVYSENNKDFSDLNGDICNTSSCNESVEIFSINYDETIHISENGSTFELDIVVPNGTLNDLYKDMLLLNDISVNNEKQIPINSCSSVNGSLITVSSNKNEIYKSVKMEHYNSFNIPIQIKDSSMIPNNNKDEFEMMFSGDAFFQINSTTINNSVISFGSNGFDNISIFQEKFFSTVGYTRMLLEKLPGKQVFIKTWNMTINTTETSPFINHESLADEEWNFDFGNGNLLTSKIIRSNETSIVIEEILTITEYEETNIVDFTGYKSFFLEIDTLLDSEFYVNQITISGIKSTNFNWNSGVNGNFHDSIYLSGLTIEYDVAYNLDFCIEITTKKAIVHTDLDADTNLTFNFTKDFYFDTGWKDLINPYKWTKWAVLYGVPVWVDITIGPEICIQGEVEAGSVLTSGFWVDASLDMGAKYEDGHFQLIWNPYFDYELHPFELDEGTIDIKTSLSLPIKAYIYSLIGPDIRPIVYLDGVIERDNQNLFWNFNLWFQADIGVCVGIPNPVYPWWGGRFIWQDCFEDKISDYHIHNWNNYPNYHDLLISKNDQKPTGTVSPGEIISYKIKCKNPNELEVNNVYIIDYLPGNIDFINCSHGGTYFYFYGSYFVYWTFDKLQPYESIDLYLNVSVNNSLAENSWIENEIEANSDETDLSNSSEYTWVIYPKPVVNINTSEKFLSINNAIYDSDTIDGHTILVKEGVYKEKIIISKSLKILGAGYNKTIIDCQGLGDVIRIFADNVAISGFTIKNSGTINDDAGILLNSDHNKIMNNKISMSNNGIVLDQFSTHNIITQNTFLNNNIGLLSYETIENLIFYNDFIQNTIQAYDLGDNSWNSSIPKGGNYWTDFDEPSEGAFDNDTDGFVDSPYRLFDGTNYDYLPLHKSYNDLTSYTTMGISSDSKNIIVGESFNVTLYINPIYPIGGWKIDTFSFSKNILSANSVQPGINYAKYFNSGNIDNNGMIYGIETFSTGPYPISNHTACVINFTADKPGKCLMQIESGEITDNNFNTIPLKTINLTLDVSPKIIIHDIYPPNNSHAFEKNGSKAFRPPKYLHANVSCNVEEIITISFFWKNHINEWNKLGEFQDVNSGNYYLNGLHSTDWILGNTKYEWSVNITDGDGWYNKTFSYTAGGSRYDVNNDGSVNFQDAGVVWIHRTSVEKYEPLYDVNSDGVVNFQDAGVVWIHRDGNIQKIKINGAATVFPIASQCADLFNDIHNGIDIIVNSPPIGTGGGIISLGEGTIDIADASRPVKASEEEAYPNVDFYDNIIAYEGIAVIVSKTVYDAGITDLTTDQILGIYNGTFTQWSSLGANGLSGSDNQIAIHQREKGSGTRDVFMKTIFGDDDAEIPEGVNLAGSWASNAGLQSAVSGSDNSIGYCGLGYADDDTTPAIKLNGVEPSSYTIKDQSYPISQSLYMYTDGEPTGAVKTFIDYVMGPDGQQIVEEEGFIRID